MRAALAALALAALSPPAARAQAYQCAPPARIDPPPPARRDGPARHAPIGGYTLAASWAPEYCRGDAASLECSGRTGRFGFVLHGLWP